MFRGPPRCAQSGVQLKPASTYLAVSPSPGLLLCQASHIYTRWLPDETGFHVHVVPCSGPPTLLGFPVAHHVASGMDRLSCISQYLRHRASRFLGLPLQPPITPPAQTGVHVYVDPCRAPPARSGFPVAPHGFQHGLVSMHLTVHLRTGLLRCPTSLLHTPRPPA